MNIYSVAFILNIWLVRVVGRKLVDLTHTLDRNAHKRPLTGILEKKSYFTKTDLLWSRTKYHWAAISYIEYFEHTGTHIDAPIHMAEGRQTLDQIPVDMLMGPGVVLDIKEKAKLDPDYGLTVADIEEYENQFGRIPDNAIVILNSGWGLKYPRDDLVFGSDKLDDPSTFHFPGYTLEAAEFLFTKRRVNVVGTDTPSVDIVQDVTSPVHMYLQSHEVPLIEYVANLDTIPQAGTTIFLGAPKFRGGTGGPTRVFAILDTVSLSSSASASHVICRSQTTCIVLGILITILFRIYS